MKQEGLFPNLATCLRLDRRCQRGGVRCTGAVAAWAVYDVRGQPRPGLRLSNLRMVAPQPTLSFLMKQLERTAVAKGYGGQRATFYPAGQTGPIERACKASEHRGLLVRRSYAKADLLPNQSPPGFVRDVPHSENAGNWMCSSRQSSITAPSSSPTALCRDFGLLNVGIKLY